MFAEVVYHTQETVLKTRNATQRAPLSSPSCVSSKDHLLAAHESVREENRALLCRDTRSPLHHRLPPLSHDRSIQAIDLMGLTHGGFCFYGGVTSFFYVRKINFLKGHVVAVLCSLCYYLHLILSVNPKRDKRVQTRSGWICFLPLLIPELNEKNYIKGLFHQFISVFDA